MSDKNPASSHPEPPLPEDESADRSRVSLGLIIALCGSMVALLGGMAAALHVSTSEQPAHTVSARPSSPSPTPSADVRPADPPARNTAPRSTSDTSGPRAATAISSAVARELGSPFATGDCFDGRLGDKHAAGLVQVRPSDVKKVKCSAPHMAEVVDVVAAKPSDSPHAERYGLSWCLSAAASARYLVGLDVRVRSYMVRAQDKDWKRGTTWVACLAGPKTDAFSPWTKPMKELGNGGMATLTPRDELHPTTEDKPAGTCFFGYPTALTGYQVPCDQPHASQLLGSKTLTATNPVDAAKQADAMCQSLFLSLPLSLPQRAGLRVVPMYNDPPTDRHRLDCAIALWTGLRWTGDATKGEVWPALTER